MALKKISYVLLGLVILLFLSISLKLLFFGVSPTKGVETSKEIVEEISLSLHDTQQDFL